MKIRWELTTDADLIDRLTALYPRHGFDKTEWEGGRNIALLAEDNLALFEYQKEGVYTGHYFFKVKGKEAVTLAKEALHVIFREVKVIIGLTPVDNKAARWMSRHLGFKSQGVVQTYVGDMELFSMTKQDWENMNE